MELITRTGLPDNFNVFEIGDTHIGSALCYERGLDKLTEMVFSEYHGVKDNYIVHHGDAIEAILIDDIRYHPATCLTPFPGLQVEDVVRTFSPVSDKILAWMIGNHEWRLWRYGNIGKDIAKRLNVPYGGFTCKIIYRDKNDDIMFKQYCTHGRKGISSTADDPIRQVANKKLSLKRHLKKKAGDCLVMSKGHVHQIIVSEPEKEVYLTDDGFDINQSYTKAQRNQVYIPPDLRWYICTGSFYKSFEVGVESYPELGEYDPVQLGFAVVKVRNRDVEGVDPIYL